MARDRSVRPRQEQRGKDVHVAERRPILLGEVEVLEGDPSPLEVVRPVGIFVGQLQNPVGVEPDDRESVIPEILVERLEYRRNLDAGRTIGEPDVDQGGRAHHVGDRGFSSGEALPVDPRERPALPAGEAATHRLGEPLIGTDHLLVDPHDFPVRVASQELRHPWIGFHDPQDDVGRLLAVQRELARDVGERGQPVLPTLELGDEEWHPEKHVVQTIECPLLIRRSEAFHERREKQTLSGNQGVPDVLENAALGIGWRLRRCSEQRSGGEKKEKGRNSTHHPVIVGSAARLAPVSEPLPSPTAPTKAVLLAFALLSGCARAIPDIPVTPFPHWDHVEEFGPVTFPTLPEAERETAAMLWEEIRAGRLGAAMERLRKLEARTPTTAPVLGLAGYLDIRRGHLAEAEARFENALALSRSDRGGDSGRDPFLLLGHALLALDRGDPEETLKRLQNLEAVAPEAPLVTDLLPTLTLDVAESRLTQARRLAREGVSGDPVTDAFRKAMELLPEAEDLILEAADASLAASEPAAARDWYDEAARFAEGTPRELDIRIRAAEAALAAKGPDAAAARLQAVEFDPRIGGLPDIARRAAALRHRVERAMLPDAYRRIRESERISREELAALLVGELGAGSEPAPVIAIDIERSWAAGLIREAVAAGYLDLFPDHTFQPKGLVNRAMLAESLARALRVHEEERHREAVRESRDRRFEDLARNHPQREAAAISVGLGLMEAEEGGARFEARRFASGAEAARAVFALRDLLGLASSG